NGIIYVSVSCSCTRISPPPDLPSFPTRRSSDLFPRRPTDGPRRSAPPRRQSNASPAHPLIAALRPARPGAGARARRRARAVLARSEEHTSELQSRFDLVCRLLLEKKKQRHKQNN